MWVKNKGDTKISPHFCIALYRSFIPKLSFLVYALIALL